MMNAMTMAHFRRQACGVVLQLPWAKSVQQRPTISPSSLSFAALAGFHVGVPAGAFQAPVPVTIIQKVSVPLSPLLPSLQCSGIGALQAASRKAFIPTPSPEWQRVHNELLRHSVEQPLLNHPLPTPSGAWKDVHEELKIKVELLAVERELLVVDYNKPSWEHRVALSTVLREFFVVLFQKNYNGARPRDLRKHQRLLVPAIHHFAAVRLQLLILPWKEDEDNLKFYCNKAFWKLNSALRKCPDRNGDVWHNDKGVLERIVGLRGALRRRFNNIGAFKGMVYRGVDFPDSVRLQLFVEGATYQDQAFLSTSKQRGLAFAGNTTFEILSRTGVSVKAMSRFNEDEVLFQPNTMFRICKVVQRYGKMTVHMEEMS